MAVNTRVPLDKVLSETRPVCLGCMRCGSNRASVRLDHYSAQTCICTAMVFDRISLLNQNMAVHDVEDGKPSRWPLLESLK